MDKKCSVCKNEKQTNEFYLSDLYRCKECNRETQRLRRKSGLVTIDKKKRTESVRNWRKKYPERRIARYKLTSRLNRNLIDKPNNCSVCNENKKLEAHHEDYSKPYDVIWCCRTCHGKLDVKRREANLD